MFNSIDVNSSLFSWRKLLSQNFAIFCHFVFVFPGYFYMNCFSKDLFSAFYYSYEPFELLLGHFSLK